MFYGGRPAPRGPPAATTDLHSCPAVTAVTATRPASGRKQRGCAACTGTGRLQQTGRPPTSLPRAALSISVQKWTIAGDQQGQRGCLREQGRGASIEGPVHPEVAKEVSEAGSVLRLEK